MAETSRGIRGFESLWGHSDVEGRKRWRYLTPRQRAKDDKRWSGDSTKRAEGEEEKHFETSLLNQYMIERFLLCSCVQSQRERARGIPRRRNAWPDSGWHPVVVVMVGLQDKENAGRKGKREATDHRSSGSGLKKPMRMRCNLAII